MIDKDWCGNKKTMGVTLGASNHTEKERHPLDYYATHWDSTRIFLNQIAKDGLDLNQNIYEQSCGGGHMADVLKEYGFNVRCSDLVDRGYPDTKIQDFLSITKEDLPFSGKPFDFMTNPPFKYAEEFIEKSMEMLQDNCNLILFLKIQFLESKARYELFKKYPPKYVYVNSSRQLCAQNGEFEKYKATALCYCWYIWTKNYSGETILRWIP
jgi:hypothetical protein